MESKSQKFVGTDDEKFEDVVYVYNTWNDERDRQTDTAP